MLLKAIDPEAEFMLVLLNNKPIKQYISARDGKDGWVEVYDLSELDALSFKDDMDFSEPEPVELKTKKLVGQVEFIKLSNNKTT